MSSPATFPNFASVVTNNAIKSGNASDSSVWSRPLSDGDFLGIPEGITVEWDLTSCPRLNGLYIKGTFNASNTAADLILNVGTVFVDMSGNWLCGDCMSETPLMGTFLVKFLDIPINEDFDPGHFGTGFLTMGANINMCGASEKTAFSKLDSIHAGDTIINCLEDIVGWEIGDELLFPGMHLSPIEDEVITISNITNNTITLSSPLKFDHIAYNGFNAYVGNLTRKIKFISENSNGTRGHIMFMKAGNMPTMVNVCHVEIRDCGRTRADIPVTDPMIDSNGKLISGTANNPRARYAWHEHRQGQSHATNIWDNIVVVGFKKWAFNNHDSNVNATNLIAYNGEGACFATERGSEIGSYINVLGVRTSLVKGLTENRANIQDFGWQGDGIWLQGPGVIVKDSVFIGHPTAGFHSYCRGPVSFPTDGTGALASTFDRSLLPTNFKLKDPNSNPKILGVPFFEISNNISIGCDTGHIIEWTESNNSTNIPCYFDPPIRSIVNNPISIYCNNGFRTEHVSHCEFNNIKLYGKNCAVNSFGAIGTKGYDKNLIFNNPEVLDFESGMMMLNDMVVISGRYRNVWDFIDGVVPPRNPIFELSGDPVFENIDNALLGNRQKLNFKLDKYTLQGPNIPIKDDVNEWFYNIAYLLPNNLQLFKIEQSPDFIPITTNDINDYPSFLKGLNNSQIFSQFGMSVGGYLSGPPVSNYLTNGIISQRQSLKQCYVFGMDGSVSKTFTTDPNYSLKARDLKTGKEYKDNSPIVLHSGWNSLTRTIDNFIYTFFVKLMSDNNTNDIIINFSSDKSKITLGESITLTWNVVNATEVKINNQIVALSGSLIVNPAMNTIYTLIASNSTGQISSSIAIMVKTLIDLLIEVVPTLTVSEAQDLVKEMTVFKKYWSLLN